MRRLALRRDGCPNGCSRSPLVLLVLLVMPLVGFPFSVRASSPAPVRTVKGTVQYYSTAHQTKVEAKMAAIEYAKIELLAQTYGTDVESSVVTSISTSASDQMSSLSSTRVKGEWLETLGEPIFQYEIDRKTGQDVIVVTLKGRVRELTEAKAEFQADVLRRYPDPKAVDTEFLDGEDFFLSFRSPVDGHLAVYLYDGAETVYCLLPYRHQSDGAWAIMAGKPYIFFSQEKSDKSIPDWMIDEYNLTCEGSLEVNKLYVIFSKNAFSKALDNGSEKDLLPRELSFNNFGTWLGRIRTADAQVNVKEINLTIKK